MSFFSCDKKDKKAPKQYSTWIVNNHDTFKVVADSAIDCNPDRSYCRSILSTHNSPNRFTLAFALDYFPTNGEYTLDTNTITPGVLLCAILFYYNDEFYYHTPNNSDTLYVSYSQNKISYGMNPSWFVNYYNPKEDSILIEGTFNIP